MNASSLKAVSEWPVESSKATTDAGILVKSHIGLAPQGSGQLASFKAKAAMCIMREVIKDAMAVEESGAFALLVEAVPPEVAAFITCKLSIPVYSIGAGLVMDSY